MQTEPATEHTFVTDLFDADCSMKFNFASLEECAQDIANGSFLPRTIHECEEPSICVDRTADVAQLVRDLRPDYRDNYRLLNWLQVNGAVSNAVRAA